jgi:hypothetical protein
MLLLRGREQRRERRALRWRGLFAPLPPLPLRAALPPSYTRCAISGAAAATRVCRLNVEP